MNRSGPRTLEDTQLQPPNNDAPPGRARPQLALSSPYMSNPFFDRPILNSPYDFPGRHWELDESGQPTQRIIERRRRAEFITPIPKPKKQKAQAALLFDEGKGLSTSEQQYE